MMSRSTCVLLASSMAASYAAWCLLQIRARKRAKDATEQVERLVVQGKMIDSKDAKVASLVFQMAIRRAAKWILYHSTGRPRPMVGQVGGHLPSSCSSCSHGGLLTLEPDYILKPLQQDERGLREVVFYEAIQFASSQKQSLFTHLQQLQSSKQQNGQNRRRSLPTHVSSSSSSKTTKAFFTNSYNDTIDVIAMWLALFVHDPIVAASEQSIVSCRQAVKRETEVLRRLSKHVPAYYGVVQNPLGGSAQSPNHDNKRNKQRSTNHSNQTNADFQKPQQPCPLSHDYIFLQDITAAFDKPNVIDIKMGTQAFEPDATSAKQESALEKYAHQATFGFRIVGMRIYQPHSPASDRRGFCHYDKEWGRGLVSRQDILEALSLFFRIHTTQKDNDDDNNASLKTRCIVNVNTELRLLRKWFDENKSLQFYSSSILIVHEGNTMANARESRNNTNTARAHHVDSRNSELTTVKMVDFGHVRRCHNEMGDVGYKHGLSVLQSCLDEILTNAKARKFV